jgi:hypothetical protein
MRRLSEDMQTQCFNCSVSFSLLCFVLSICRRSCHFGKDRWLSKAPDCKVLMKRWSLWFMYKAFETSYFMDASLFSISFFTVLEQLGIGGSNRVVVVVG